MKKKILIGSIFAVLIMLSMPVISNIQAEPAPATTPAEETDECSICGNGDGDCGGLCNALCHHAEEFISIQWQVFRPKWWYHAVMINILEVLIILTPGCRLGPCIRSCDL